MEMLVLRRRRSDGLESAHVPVGTGSDVEAVFQDLSPAEVRGLRRDDSVLAATESMPMTLIEPVLTSGAAPATSGQAGWGIAAVGALTSPFTGTGVTVAV